MKRKLGTFINITLFLTSLAAVPTLAFAAPNAAAQKPKEVTGCLQQGPAAKEYLLRTADGTTWGVTETDMLMNDYLDHTVTITGEVMHPSADERSAGGAHHFLRARDLLVESDTCQK